MPVNSRRSVRDEAPLSQSLEDGHSMDRQRLDVDEDSVMRKRRQLRAKITRAMNRVRDSVRRCDISKRRLQKELDEIRSDFSSVADIHSELYDCLPVSDHPRLDQWEADLSNDKFSFEEEMEDYLASLVDSENNRTVTESQHVNDQAPSQQSVNCQVSSEQRVTGQVSDGPTSNSSVLNSSAMNSPHPNRQSSNGHISNEQSSTRSTVPNTRVSGDLSRVPFDSWLTNLTEFRETQVSESVQNLSLGEVLYRLEASKDIPAVRLSIFDGNPLKYVEFIETFKIHVHDKPHLTDDMRMVQLKMHLTGDAERAILGLGSGGMMYATALQIIKEQFGQESVIARAFIDKLTKGSKVMPHDREGLRDLSLDIINCVATLQRMNYFSDANTTESLRQIVRRFPDHLILKWKSAVTEIRERGETPDLQHISNFLRKQVKSAFDPDFGDIETGRQSNRRSEQNKDRRGIHSTQHTPGEARPKKCYVCKGDHKVTHCPTFVDSTAGEKVMLVKNNRLCFSCLIQGHSSKDCRSKKRCGKNGCDRLHHPLLHTDPPTASGATSTLDKDGILPVIRARFRSHNGRVREGNILVDSGAATTIIRRDFAKALGLQGKRESLELSVVGGERIAQRDSRRVKFWISGTCSAKEFEIEAHEIDKTIVSVPPLDRPWLSSFPHLNDIKFNHKAGPIDLILGVQYSHLHVEDEIRQGLPFEPVAKRNRLGWFVIGARNTKRPTTRSVNFVQKIDSKYLHESETLGIRTPDCSCPNSVSSPDDKKAMDKFERSCHKERDRYMNGPPFFSKPKHEWPERPPLQASLTDEELGKPQIVHTNMKKVPPIDCCTFSSLQRLIRITAYCLRFVHNLKCKLNNKQEMFSDTLNREEVEMAEHYWIHTAQEDSDKYEDRYRDLPPFKEDGIIRVGSRVRISTLPYEQVHAVLLPASSYVSKLILRDIHNKMGHQGCERTLCESRRKYWIVRGRGLVQEIVRSCTVCRKLREQRCVTLMAVFAEVKCLVNSRPLGYSSNDPNDSQPLTPNHFLLGRASAEVPQDPFRESKSIRKRFEFLQTLINQFWKRFIKEYFHLLMRRAKWSVKGRQMKIGDIVWVSEPNVPRGKWNLGHVITVFPGDDGVVRNVEIKTKFGVYKRSVQKCCLILETSD